MWRTQNLQNFLNIKAHTRFIIMHYLFIFLFLKGGEEAAWDRGKELWGISDSISTLSTLWNLAIVLAIL